MGEPDYHLGLADQSDNDEEEGSIDLLVGTEAVGDKNVAESWTPDDLILMNQYLKNHPKLVKQDERGRKPREKLIVEIQKKLDDKYSVDDIQNKVLDLQGKWRSEDIDITIAFFRENPVLWDFSLSEYRSKTQRSIALEKLSRQLEYRKNGAEIITKFESLRTIFNEKSKKGETGTEGKSGKRWPYFQDLLFLKKVNTQRKSFANVCIPMVSPFSSQSSMDNPKSPEEGQNVFEGSGIKRSHSKYGNSDDKDELKAKIIKSLDYKPDALVHFGSNVAETLRKFSETNQEFVKVQLQQVLAISLKKESKGEDMPEFVVLS